MLIAALNNLPFARNFLSRNKNSNTAKSTTPTSAGMIASALGTAMSCLFVGAAGLVVGLGTAFYLGCKSVKHVISSHLKNR